MTENPSKYNVAAGGNNHPTNDIGDAIDWLDTLIKADEADTLEILENALWHLSPNHTEGDYTIGTSELLERLRGAISRRKGQIINNEIELRLGDEPLGR